MEFPSEWLNSSRATAANKWDVQLNTRREIPYLQATLYYFVYHINTIALYWKEKPTSLMNENKWIDNPKITIVECVGADSQDGKMCWIIITKTTMVVIFNSQNPHLLTLSLPTEDVFTWTAKIGQWQIFQLPIFILSREKWWHQSHWIRNFWFSFCLLVFFLLY